MKLKDLFKMVEDKNKFNEFMGSIEREVIVLGGHRFEDENQFKDMKTFIKTFNKELYGNLTKDTELRNENGYIKFDVEYKAFERIQGVLTEVTEKETYSIYIGIIQEWN